MNLSAVCQPKVTAQVHSRKTISTLSPTVAKARFTPQQVQHSPAITTVDELNRRLPAESNRLSPPKVLLGTHSRKTRAPSAAKARFTPQQVEDSPAITTVNEPIAVCPGPFWENILVSTRKPMTWAPATAFASVPDQPQHPTPNPAVAVGQVHPTASRRLLGHRDRQSIRCHLEVGSTAQDYSGKSAQAPSNLHLPCIAAPVRV